MLNNPTPSKKIRCAIYTRKSHEEGLDQQFNSLDAQRLAAESYISSQIHEGWVLLPNYYDDGGYSGGNIERPALKRLFADIKENKIDCIVVYKIDRLTRSLLDFAGIIDLFDEHKVSFVSVTQSFNTSNSMGRLMLNVLLSFAQYERELTGERIRDKFEASKKKGMWMGGNLPLGYDAKDRMLHINENESKIIRSIYDDFLKTHSITETTRSSNKAGFTTKNWISSKGKLHNGKKFNKNAVERILKSSLYAGKIEHKGKIYQGLHEPIISDEIWAKTQNIFAINKQQKINLPISRVSAPPLLKGLMICQECGCKMSTAYTNKKGKKYRYYICSNKHRGRNEECKVGRIAANEIEDLVKTQILKILKKPEIVVQTISQAKNEISQVEIVNYFQNIEKVWDELFPVEQVRIVHSLIEKIVINKNGVDLRIFKEGLTSLASEALN
jgi:site-specific DNA recombinase